MRVQHNIPAMNSYRNYNNNAKSINKNLEKLSSGYRINRAGDDAAGLAISEKMRAQITGLEVAQKNAKDGISLVQTAEGALTEVHDMLNRMYALAEQSGNGTYDNSVDRNQLNKEVQKLREEIDRIGKTTNFNGTKLFLGGLEAETSGVDGVVATYANNTFTDDLTITIASQMVDGKPVFSLIAPSGSTITTASGSGVDIGTMNTGTLSGYPLAQVTDKTSMPVTISYTSGTGTSAVTSTVDLNVTLAGFDPKTNGAQNGSIKIPAASANTVATGNTAQGKAAKQVQLSSSGIDLWVGDFPDSNNKINVKMDAINSVKLVIDDKHVNLTTQEGALNSLSYIKDAIDYVSDMRGTLGAAQNRLEHTINNLSVMQENIQDAESTIRDTDVAEEMMKYTKNSILVQSAQAMLAQANQQPQSVLQLLQ